MDFSALSAYNPNQEPQRPSVNFEMRAVEDRNLEATDGTTQMKDVAWAIVRAPGAKDTVEKLASEWLAQLKVYAKDGRMPPSWPSDYANAFELWKKGEEIPMHGTPIKTWPPLSPAQRKNVLAAGILTIEDLAVANDETRGKIGMGGHSVVQMAQKWLEESRSLGSTSKALSAAQIELASLKETVREQAEQIKALFAAAPKKA